MGRNIFRVSVELGHGLLRGRSGYKRQYTFELQSVFQGHHGLGENVIS